MFCCAAGAGAEEVTAEGAIGAAGDAFKAVEPSFTATCCAQMFVATNSDTAIAKQALGVRLDMSLKGKHGSKTDLIVVERELVEGAFILAVQIIRTNRPKSSHHHVERRF